MMKIINDTHPIPTIVELGYLDMKDVEKLSTSHMLAYYKKYRNIGWKFHCSCCGEILNQRDQMIYDMLNKYRQNIKNMLGTREHVPRIKFKGKKSKKSMRY